MIGLYAWQTDFLEGQAVGGIVATGVVLQNNDIEGQRCITPSFRKNHNNATGVKCSLILNSLKRSLTSLLTTST